MVSSVMCVVCVQALVLLSPAYIGHWELDQGFRKGVKAGNSAQETACQEITILGVFPCTVSMGGIPGTHMHLSPSAAPSLVYFHKNVFLAPSLPVPASWPCSDCGLP